MENVLKEARELGRNALAIHYGSEVPTSVPDHLAASAVLELGIQKLEDEVVELKRQRDRI